MAILDGSPKAYRLVVMKWMYGQKTHTAALVVFQETSEPFTTLKFITIYGILCLQYQEDLLWPVYGLAMRSPAPWSFWI
jgi:hypothetical protein